MIMIRSMPRSVIEMAMALLSCFLMACMDIDLSGCDIKKQELVGSYAPIDHAGREVLLLEANGRWYRRYSYTVDSAVIDSGTWSMKNEDASGPCVVYLDSYFLRHKPWFSYIPIPTGLVHGSDSANAMDPCRWVAVSRKARGAIWLDLNDDPATRLKRYSGDTGLELMNVVDSRSVSSE